MSHECMSRQDTLYYSSSLNVTANALSLELIRTSLSEKNTSQFDEYKRLVADRLSDPLSDRFSLKLHPIDENLKKV